MAPGRSVPVLRFRTGGVTCAIAARSVFALAAPVSGVRPLCDILGLRAPQDAPRERWLLRLADGARSLDVLIEGPVAIEELSARDVLERPRALVLAPDHPILGFARRGDQVILLLNMPSLFDLGLKGPPPCRA